LGVIQDHPMLRLGGVVLCGGSSQRMGRPKAWLPFDSETLLARVVRLLQAVVDPVVVVAGPSQDVPPLPPGVHIARDEVSGMGPLQGIVAGLENLRCQADASFVTGCDTPFIQPGLIRRLTILIEDNWICVPRVNGLYHPLSAIYRVDVLGAARALLLGRRLSATNLFEVVPTRVVSASELADIDPELRSLRNLNNPDEYGRAVREMEGHKQ